MGRQGQLVVVVRHGETEWSATGRHTGRTDIALTERGRSNARAAGAWLAHETFDRVWCSPLRRARDTCALAGFGEAAVIYADMVEWDYGDYEGLTHAEIVAHDPDWMVWTHGAPGGESPDDMQQRVDRLVSRLLDAGGRTLIFAHGHLLRALAARWIELPVSEGRRMLLDTAAVGELGWYHGRRALARWNLVPAD